MDSFKVLTECPLIIMLLFQVYPKFIQKNIPQMLPLMMNILGLQFSASNLTPQLRVRFREFVAAQVKTLSLITYFLRGFTELMRPYEDTIANNVLVLIRFCPQESVSTRKELLVDFRHILATDFRKGFYKHLDFFIDETFLMGPGQQAYETLRPLAFSTIADLVHHSREYLSFAQLSKVVFLFAKSIHDVQLPVIIQTTSVRILMNISEKFAATTYADVSEHDSIISLTKVIPVSIAY
jgi:transformation/transcription domain-associated protein